MRILVTGAFGYLGLALVRRLAAAHHVIAFGHAPRNPAAHAVIPEKVTLVEGDLLDVAATVSAYAPARWTMASTGA